MRRVGRPVRADPPGGAHPPRALVRGRPGNNAEDNYFGGNAEWIFGNGDEETRGRLPRRAARPIPTGPVYGQYIPRRQAAADDLHAAQQDRAAARRSTSCSTSIFRHGTPEELEEKTGRPHHDVDGRAVRPHLRRAARAGRRRQVRVRDEGKGGRPTAARATDRELDDRTSSGRAVRRHDHRHGRPPAPGRHARWWWRTTAARRTRAPTTARGYGGTLLLQLRRALPPRAAVRGLPDGGDATPAGARRSTRATGSASPAPTRTRTTPGTR